MNNMDISLEKNDSGWNTTSPGRSVIYDLVYAATSGADTAERLRAVVMLGKSDDPRAVRPLMDLLDDSDPAIRLSAITALGQLKSGRPVDDLIERLRDRREQAEIRKQVVQTLAAIRSTGAIHGLREFAADSDEDAALRTTAEDQLRELGSW